MNIRYLIPRLIRHFIPEGLARLLLRQRWIIQPGLESSNPQAAAERYTNALAYKGFAISGRSVLVFGYGGRFAIGVELLKRGAAHVVLCDHFISLDHQRNLELLPQFADYLLEEGGVVKPLPEFITLLHGDIRDPGIQNQIVPVDCILSNSVFEHLGDVSGITRSLAGVTRADGVHLHFVDLRDHYFKYPFEMLAYSDCIWRNFLNPTSNLNRCRLNDYKRIFQGEFERVDVHVLERLEAEFQVMRPHIRPEFLSGDPFIDSVSLIQIFAENPRE